MRAGVSDEAPGLIADARQAATSPPPYRHPLNRSARIMLHSVFFPQTLKAFAAVAQADPTCTVGVS